MPSDTSSATQSDSGFHFFRFHARHQHLGSLYGDGWFALKAEAFARFFGEMPHGAERWGAKGVLNTLKRTLSIERISLGTILGLIITTSLIGPVRASVTATPHLTAGPIILVEGDCGRDAHRNGRGVCEPNWREMEGRSCPRGYHLGPEGKRCWPN